MHQQEAGMQLRRSARGCGQIVPSALGGAHLCTRAEGHDGTHACSCGANWRDDLLVVEPSQGESIEREPAAGAA